MAMVAPFFRQRALGKMKPFPLSVRHNVKVYDVSNVW
jgi:hypothetical protein